jgi:hypothetical protein
MSNKVQQHTKHELLDMVKDMPLKLTQNFYSEICILDILKEESIQDLESLPDNVNDA